MLRFHDKEKSRTAAVLGLRKENKMQLAERTQVSRHHLLTLNGRKEYKEGDGQCFGITL